MDLLPARATGRIFSFGGGIQSMAVLTLAAQGKIRYDAFVFANVGAKSENPKTLHYLECYAIPYAQAHDIPLWQTQRLYKGKPDDLRDAIERDDRSIPIPAYMSGGAPGRRSCTTDYKIEVIDRWIKRAGYERCELGIGISWDEWERAGDEHWHDHWGKRKFGFWKRREHPLLNLRLNREDCKRLILGAGLPVPPKSSCYFCPFHKPHEWVTMRRDEPELFENAIAVQDRLNEKRAKIGKDQVYLHSRMIKLSEIGVQPLLFEDDDQSNCESGYCMT